MLISTSVSLPTWHLVVSHGNWWLFSLGKMLLLRFTMTLARVGKQQSQSVTAWIKDKNKELFGYNVIVVLCVVVLVSSGVNHGR